MRFIQYKEESTAQEIMFFNKKILSDVGIDWNDLYDAQQMESGLGITL